MSHFAPIQQVYSYSEQTRRDVSASYGIEPSYHGYQSPFAQKSFEKTFEPTPQKQFTEPKVALKTPQTPKEPAKTVQAAPAPKVEEEAPVADPFEQLMAQYPCYKHMFENQGLMEANGVSFHHEVRMISKSQEEIAKEKAVQQLQVQCVMAGADAILGLRCEYIHQPEIGVCVCTAYGTAVKYKLMM